jgi:predicted PurR-regulated permease PerM
MRRLVRNAGADLPVALLALAFFLMLLFQMVQLVRQSQSLVVFAANQENAMQEAARLRQAADALAGDIAQLAQQGNANAKQVVDEMARQNINLHPQTPPSPPTEK